MEVYVVSMGVAYEGESLLGVFSDYVKAREFELECHKRYGVSIDEGGAWVAVRKVELDRDYKCIGDIGEQV